MRIAALYDDEEAAPDGWGADEGKAEEGEEEGGGDAETASAASSWYQRRRLERRLSSRKMLPTDSAAPNNGGRRGAVVDEAAREELAALASLNATGGGFEKDYHDQQAVYMVGSTVPPDFAHLTQFGDPSALAAAEEADRRRPQNDESQTADNGNVPTLVLAEEEAASQVFSREDFGLDDGGPSVDGWGGGGGASSPLASAVPRGHTPHGHSSNTIPSSRPSSISAATAAPSTQTASAAAGTMKKGVPTIAEQRAALKVHLERRMAQQRQRQTRGVGGGGERGGAALYHVSSAGGINGEDEFVVTAGGADRGSISGASDSDDNAASVRGRFDL